MCGIAALVGGGWDAERLEAMAAGLSHRGPDDRGAYEDPRGYARLGHRRLAILDLSAAGRQPMSDPNGRYRLAYNGEIYNYRELRAELAGDYPFHTATDSEVLLAAWCRWGPRCLDRLVGMFAFVIWDERDKVLHACRDRFGVKPLYYQRAVDGGLALASEIGALRHAGLPTEPDAHSWAAFLAHGLLDHGPRTFWRGIRQLPAGHVLRWRDGATRVERWYDLAARVGAELDGRPLGEVEERYLELLTRSVELRFRSDVPVGVNLSGGLDSSVLLALIRRLQKPASEIRAFTFITGDPRYDELPWVERMVRRTGHPLTCCRLAPEDVPRLAASVHAHQAEPFGGIPTLAYARLFEEARRHGVVVLLDGQGMDEQLAGYDYYTAAGTRGATPAVQGSSHSAPLRPDCLTGELRRATGEWAPPAPFPDRLRNLQTRDLCHTKIPRALRFNDRISMRVSCELREPFLDHRLVELALRQPPERKIRDGHGKWLLRSLAARLIPGGVAEAPKRPLQTPQREWLRGPLEDWADASIEAALATFGGSWLHTERVRREWRRYRDEELDNSYFVWQWISLGLLAAQADDGEGLPESCASC